MTKVLKFDGKYLIEDSKTLCHVDGQNIKVGDGSSGGLNFIMCRVEEKFIKEMKDDDTILCRIEGKDIKEGLDGKTMIKISDAAKAIGSKSENALTAAMWYLFCRPNK
jgi:hypothetical protein